MNSKQSNSSLIIRASEINQYCYCSFAWYLQRRGYKPKSDAIERGANAHTTLGYQLESFDQSIDLTKIMIKTALILLTIGLLGILGWIIL